MKPFNQYLSESVPTNNTGSTGPMAGLSGITYSAIQGYDKRLFPLGDDILDQDYQTPGQSGQAMWRYSNVYPVQKLTDQDVDNMVDASKAVSYTHLRAHETREERGLGGLGV